MNNKKDTPRPDCFPARIVRGATPQCPAKAVIPLYEVATDENIKTLSNCFVHVQSTNRTYYIDSQHRFVMTWSGMVYEDNYDAETNPKGYRGQLVFDQATGDLIVFDNTGEATTIGEGGGSDVASISDADWTALWTEE